MVKGLKIFIFFITIIFIILSSNLVTGCWDRREPEQVGLSLGIGLDVNENDAKEILVEMANPLALEAGKGGGGEGGGEEDFVISAEGETFFEAARHLSKRTTREMTFAHNAIIIFSSELASEGLEGAIDFLDRIPEFRMIAHPFVVEEDLEDALAIDFMLEEFGSKGLVKHVQFHAEEVGFFRELDVRDMIARLAKPGWELTLPQLKIEGNNQDNNNNNNENENENNGGSNEGNDQEITEKDVELPGIAAFRGGELEGYLNASESRGVFWVTGVIDSAVLVVDSPATEMGTVTLEVLDSESKMECKVDEEEITMEVNVEAFGWIQEDTSREEWLGEYTPLIDSLNRRFAAVIENDIENALNKTQNELETDVFGFGNYIYRNEYEKWKEVGDEWRKEFPNLSVEVSVEAEVLRTGLIKDSIEID